MPDDVLQIDDEDRYARLRLIGWWDQARLARARVLVVGAGALGNEVLKNLALVGIGNIHVIDFDRIDTSNLSRSVLFRAADAGQPKALVAARALRDLNPEIRVHALTGNVLTDLGLGFFAEMDVVIGCLDNREARLWVNRSCWKVSRPWIDGGIQEISGVIKVYQPPDGSCYECTMTDNDYQLINLRYSCPLLKREDLLAGKVPTAPTISSIIAGWQTQEALKLLHALPVKAGTALIIHGQTNHVYQTQLPRRDDCLSHETYPAPTSLDLCADEHTGQDLFDAVRADWPEAGPLTLVLERDLIVRLDCAHCGTSRSILRPLALVRFEEAQCCGETMRPEMVHLIAEDSPLAREKLRDLSIPAYEWLRLRSADEDRCYSLHADRARVLALET